MMMITILKAMYSTLETLFPGTLFLMAHFMALYHNIIVRGVIGRFNVLSVRIYATDTVFFTISFKQERLVDNVSLLERVPTVGDMFLSWDSP